MLSTKFYLQNGVKRTKTAKLSDVPACKSARIDSVLPVRRSSRHHRVRGEVEVEISSNCTLRDLKLKVKFWYHIYCPAAQYLIISMKSNMTLICIIVILDFCLLNLYRLCGYSKLHHSTSTLY